MNSEYPEGALVQHYIAPINLKIKFAHGIIFYAVNSLAICIMFDVMNTVKGEGEAYYFQIFGGYRPRKVVIHLD